MVNTGNMDMKKTILVYGLLTGTVIIGSMLWGITATDHGGFSVWLGYLIMIVAMTMIFIGIKRYRDTELGGVIKFNQAFLLGLGIALIASFIYVLVWEIYLAMTDYAFIDGYSAGMIERAQNEGMAEAEMQALQAKMAKMKADYANVFYRLPLTFSEIFPVGLLVSLISAGILRNPIESRP